MSLLLGAASLALSGAGLVSNLLGQNAQTSATEAYNKQLEEVANLNYDQTAKTLKEQYESSTEDMLQYKTEGDSFLGEQKANIAAGNLSGGSLSGLQAYSSANLQEDLSAMKEQNILDYENGMAQAAIDKKANSIGQSTAGSAYTTAGTLLTGTSNLFSSAYKMFG